MYIGERFRSLYTGIQEGISGYDMGIITNERFIKYGSCSASFSGITVIYAKMSSYLRIYAVEGDPVTEIMLTITVVHGSYCTAQLSLLETKNNVKTVFDVTETIEPEFASAMISAHELGVIDGCFYYIERCFLTKIIPAFEHQSPAC